MLALTKFRPRKTWETLPSIWNVQDEINRLFEDFFSPLSPEQDKTHGWYPAIDIYEEEDKFLLKAELPGMDKKDIKITVDDDMLVIRGERKEEKEVTEGKYRRIERSFGTFGRTFQLPPNLKVDKVKAQYKDGVLELELPKGEESKPKQIDVKVS